MRAPIAIYSLVISMVVAVAAHSGPDYVPRPQGWFILAPPLTKTGPLTSKFRFERCLSLFKPEK